MRKRELTFVGDTSVGIDLRRVEPAEYSWYTKLVRVSEDGSIVVEIWDSNDHHLGERRLQPGDTLCLSCEAKLEMSEKP